MISNATLKRQIILDLKRRNICNYCILRFLNVKNSDFYKNVDDYFKNVLQEIKDEKLKIKRNDSSQCVNNQNSEMGDLGKATHNVKDSPESKRKRLQNDDLKDNTKLDDDSQNIEINSLSPCSACLGLLQHSNKNEYIDAVVQRVNDAGHDSDEVTFAISLPITYLLRNRSIWLYLISNYLDFFMANNYKHEIKQDHLMVSVKEVWKWLSNEKIAAKLGKTANSGVVGNYHVNINVEYEDDEAETSCLFKMYPKEFEYRSHHKRKFHGELLTRKKVESMLMETNMDLFLGNYPVPPEIPKSFMKFSSIECMHDSIYIAGRYNKLSRSLSQTPWMINGERKMESSVEEIIEKPISEMIPNSGIKFASSGREDVDVRTLGKGRPFVVDISNPRRTKLNRLMLKDIEKKINDSSSDVFVRDLQIVQKEDLIHIKAGEETKTKTYTCYCLIKLENVEKDVPELKEKLKELEKIKDLVIEQKTPIRVLHRRPLALRLRTIYWLKADFHEVKNNNFFFKLSLQVGAGTYIKEFVHGDFGRTSPNLSDIIERETDILALDVEEVALQWPPSLSDDEDDNKIYNK